MFDPLNACLNLNKEIRKKPNGYTWGNVSIKCGDNEIIVKPSGIPFEKIKSDMSRVDMKSGG